MSIVFILSTLILITVSKRKEKEFNYNWFQNDFMVEPGHIEVARCDKRYVKYLSARSFKFNRTCVAHNVTLNLKVDVGNDLEVVSQTYKFASNEYRLFPIRVGVKVCKGLLANIMGVERALNCGNFTGCPFIKDRTYHVCNFVVDPQKLPPYLPSGSFMLQWTFSHKNTELYALNSYGRVYRNITRK